PGDPATRRPGGPAARRPGDPATRRPGGPAAQRPSGPAAQRPATGDRRPATGEGDPAPTDLTLPRRHTEAEVIRKLTRAGAQRGRDLAIPSNVENAFVPERDEAERQFTRRVEDRHAKGVNRRQEHALNTRRAALADFFQRALELGFATRSA